MNPSGIPSRVNDNLQGLPTIHPRSILKLLTQMMPETFFTSFPSSKGRKRLSFSRKIFFTSIIIIIIIIIPLFGVVQASSVANWHGWIIGFRVSTLSNSGLYSLLRPRERIFRDCFVAVVFGTLCRFTVFGFLHLDEADGNQGDDWSHKF